MPNHVTNRVVVSGPIEDVAAFKKLMIVEDKDSVISSIHTAGTDVGMFDTFDFNQITPQPAILDLIAQPPRRGPHGRMMLSSPSLVSAITGEQKETEATEDDQAEIDKIFAGFDHPLSALYPNTMPGWYDWRLSNWGTKWNAYNFAPVEDHARFEFTMDTAWSAPNPIYDKLAKRFPTLGFDLAWFDEGWCHAGQGSLGHCTTTGSSEDFYTDANDQIYQRVYGFPPEKDNEEELDREDFSNSSILEELWAAGGSAFHLRMTDNFTCYDVGAAMDEHGQFPIESISYSDDGIMNDDQLLVIRNVRHLIMERLGITA